MALELGRVSCLTVDVVTDVEHSHDDIQDTALQPSVGVLHLAEYFDPVWIGVVPDSVSQGSNLNHCPEVVQSLKCEGDPERNGHLISPKSGS